MHMSRTVIDIDDEMLARAQRAMKTGTKRETVNAALELAAAVDADRRAQLLESFRDLLGRLDVDLIEQDEPTITRSGRRDVPGRHLDGGAAPAWK
jgi:Arc/MetJ family transcription regulator